MEIDWGEDVVYEVPGAVRVTFEWVGEGWSGDYDPEDPEDQPLLRFTVDDLEKPPDEYGQESRSWQDNSYCTQLPVWTPTDQLERIARAIARSTEDEYYWKRILEEWSWVGPEDLK